MQQLSALDASFTYLETANTPMHLGSVAIYDPSTAPGSFVRFKDILRFVGSRLGGARAFRQKLVRVPFDLDHPYWIEDANFDLEYHIRHIALPKPGDWRQLCIQVARLHARSMDLSKPLWEFTVIEGLDNVEGVPPGSFAVVHKVHHAAIDGLSGVEMLSAIHDLDAEMKPRFPKSEWQPEEVPAMGNLLFRSYFNMLSQPWRTVETIGKSLPGLARLTGQVSKGDVAIKNARTAPKTRLNGKVSSHRAWDAVKLSLAEVRAVKDAIPDGTVNDVMLAIVGGALRKYLQAKGELTKETLTAMAPISVRDDSEKSSMGNLVSAMIVGLGTTIEDPIERLQFVHQEAVNSKAMTNAVGAKNLSDYSKLIPAGLAGIAARLYTSIGLANAHSPIFNCTITNVPGPRVPLYFAGAKMLALYGSGPIFDGMGLINTIYSYGPDIAISFTADRDMMPDPADYAEALRQSFEELKNAVSVPAI